MKSVLLFIFWAICVGIGGAAMWNDRYEAIWIMFAALFTIPLAFKVLDVETDRLYGYASAGLCLGFVLREYEIDRVFWLAIPFVLVCWGVSLREAVKTVFESGFSLAGTVRLFALGYGSVGAAWAFCTLADIRPLGFDPVITALTAAHFFTAGLALSATVYFHLRNAGSGVAVRAAGVLSLLGMPLTAIGITSTHWKFSTVIEEMTALLFIGYVLIIIILQIKLIKNKYTLEPTKRYSLAALICLSAGVSLALLYALRFQFPMDWVTIPNMKLWHGTANSLFAWLTLRGMIEQEKATP